MSCPAIIDSHCHLDDGSFDPDREAVLASAHAKGVVAMVIPAVDAAGWPGLLALCQAHADLYPALGLHPVYTHHHRDADLAELEGLILSNRLCAIGEIGLDYFIPDADRARQLELFERQLQIARDADLPVILHNRKAHNDMLALLKRIRPPGGIAHAFNGSLELAREYLALGFKLGFGGMLTFERSNKLRRLARDLPLEALVLETDAPDLTVAAHRGERNSPAYLPDVLAALAEVRGETPERVAEQTCRNVRDALRLN